MCCLLCLRDDFKNSNFQNMDTNRWDGSKPNQIKKNLEFDTFCLGRGGQIISSKIIEAEMGRVVTFCKKPYL